MQRWMPKHSIRPEREPARLERQHGIAPAALTRQANADRVLFLWLERCGPPGGLRTASVEGPETAPGRGVLAGHACAIDALLRIVIPAIDTALGAALLACSRLSATPFHLPFNAIEVGARARMRMGLRNRVRVQNGTTGGVAAGHEAGLLPLEPEALGA